ncbi:MAG: glucuronyl esterase domain-containing protein [Planctomycetota bacterium]
MRLEFAAHGRPSFEKGVWIPGGAGPFPVLLVAPRHYQIPWAEDALARGYLVCLYPGIDHMHSEPDYPGWERAWETFRAAHPGATWTEILAKAWLASRALDHILDPGSRYPVARGQVAIIGHSRYGKQAMVAAAFDERIAAVVARSAGTPTSSGSTSPSGAGLRATRTSRKSGSTPSTGRAGGRRFRERRASRSPSARAYAETSTSIPPRGRPCPP